MKSLVVGQTFLSAGLGRQECLPHRFITVEDEVMQFQPRWLKLSIFLCAVQALCLTGAGEAHQAPAFPTFNCNIATLTVGRDGRVYMTSLGAKNEGLVLRMNRDGSERVCAWIGPILYNATANAQGVMGIDCAHNSKRVLLLAGSAIRRVGRDAQN